MLASSLRCGRDTPVGTAAVLSRRYFKDTLWPKVPLYAARSPLPNQLGSKLRPNYRQPFLYRHFGASTDGAGRQVDGHDIVGCLGRAAVGLRMEFDSQC